MDSNLILHDIDFFLDRYTRFMTKDIYISNKTYKCFLEHYQYLYEILKKTHFLYSDNPNYKKMMDIEKKQVQLVKLHNQKYLQGAIKKYQSFFEKLYPGDEFNIRSKSIILSEEDKMLVIQKKNIESLIVGKIKFLSKKFNYSDNDILVLVENKLQEKSIFAEFQKMGINVSIKTIKEYGLTFLNNEEKILDDNQKYTFFSEYFIKKLFPRKEIFHKVYNAFSKYIYLNKDYKDYETFKDYHNYMYKRKFLASNMSLKKFNEQEVIKRRTYLRTIQDEIMQTKEEVDIANFLYLNSISYHYQYDTSNFSIWLDEKKNEIQYIYDKEPLKINNVSSDETIYLYASYNENKSFLEVLVYELIKRRYPLELVGEDVLYNKLKDTTIYNYFSEFIRNYLIPVINHYEENNNLENTRLNVEQQKIVKDLYLMYKKQIEKNCYVKEKELFSRIEKDILKRNYHYLILLGDIPCELKVPTLTIAYDYKEVYLLKENIKLLYDYKKYLYRNQNLPIAHVYLNYNELNTLTTSFLKENLAIINKGLGQNKKEIQIQYYDDHNRLHIYQDIGISCDNILKLDRKNIMMAFTNLRDMKLLVSSQLFSKFNKNTLITQDRQKISCEEILKISKLYDTIILPYLIKDYYHDDYLRTDYDYYIKVMLYAVLCKCRQKVILLCPKSKCDELKEILKNIDNINIME